MYQKSVSMDKPIPKVEWNPSRQVDRPNGQHCADTTNY